MAIASIARHERNWAHNCWNSRIPDRSVYSYIRGWVPDPLYNYTGEVIDPHVPNCIPLCRGLRHPLTWVPLICYIARFVSL